jgi:hypothetical protein
MRQGSACEGVGVNFMPGGGLQFPC